MMVAFTIMLLLASASSISSLAPLSRRSHQLGPRSIRFSGSRYTEANLAAIRGGSETSHPNENKTEPVPPTSALESLLHQAENLINGKDANGAFALLAEAYQMDPTSSQIALMFQKCMEINVESSQTRFDQWKNAGENNRFDFTENELTNLFQDRMGLASLCIDKEQYDEAGVQLRIAIEEASVWLNHALNIDVIDNGTFDLPDLASTPFEHWQPKINQARYLLYRTNAACCKWDTYFQDGDKLRNSLEHTILPSGHIIRLLHPFDALKFPCVPLELASKIAESYAYRALESVGVTDDFVSRHPDSSQPRKVVTVTRETSTYEHVHSTQSHKKIRIGYLSPDFTSRHPLAFLMQHVFRCHDKSMFSIYTYSLSANSRDEGAEVRAIRESSDCFTYLSTVGRTAVELYQRIMQDEIDILVDLCGYAGTSIVAEIMASRSKLQQDMNSKEQYTVFPIHVAYMGFPGSMGSSRIWDYTLFDKHVVPSSLRKHYSGALVYMPHCYFVNSHKTVIGGPEDGIMLANEDERFALKMKYGLHPLAFVYCCHSRPDKIDPSTFQSWMKALCAARKDCKAKGVADDALPVLWLLKSGNAMEVNLRNFVRREFGDEIEQALVFADVAERKEHLKRLGCADVFLDTPAYGAHTLGCDALYMGVPMISLLRTSQDKKCVNMADSDKDLEIVDQCERRLIPTDKLASVVGASLLHASSCEDLIVHDMEAYESTMIKCATDAEWFQNIRYKLVSSRAESPLFDTDRWVRNLEAAFLKMKEVHWNDLPDIAVEEASTRSE